MKLKYDFEITDFMSEVYAVSKQPNERGKKVIRVTIFLILSVLC